MRRQDFQFELPAELIARHPPLARSASRLLHLPRDGKLSDLNFTQLPELLQPGDLLIVNDSRVVPARLAAQKTTGGKVEILLERVVSTTRALVKLRASKTVKMNRDLQLPGGHQARVVARDDDLFELEFNTAPLEVFYAHGEVPLPPYLDRAPDEEDQERYQTIYAQDPGSVAAPTAGLHFDQAMFDSLKQRAINVASVTLHVGSGTYQPVRCDAIEEHQMHAEQYTISQSLIEQIEQTRRSGGRVVAVGTTSLRTLESAYASGAPQAGTADTRIFIYPGYRFRCVDMLLTNFHLSESTLLMLVSAFAGLERIKAAYQHAIEQRYRFFSYGDCMLLDMHPDGRQGAS